MKINVKSPGKIALSVIVCGFFIISCRDRGAADDTNPATIVGGTDPAHTVSHDSTAGDETHHTPTVDTSHMGMTAKPDTAAAGKNIDTTAKPVKNH